MPVFRKLGHHAAVTIGIETCLEESVARYTPGLPRVDERLKAATALRRFGIPVTLQVNPVLPYGDWRSDAGRFAEMLVENGDYIYVRSITDGTDRVERQIRATTLAKRLAEDRKFHFLRPDTAVPVLNAVEALAPEKLKTPNFKNLGDRQLRMFAA
jgi:DNA repair photolyase